MTENDKMIGMKGNKEMEEREILVKRQAQDATETQQDNFAQNGGDPLAATEMPVEEYPALEEGSLCEALYKKTGMIYPIKGGWGTSLQDAIVILGGGVNMEYVLMSRMFPGCDIEKQGLIADGDRHYDVILFSNKQGEEFKVCFDITKFYGV